MTDAQAKLAELMSEVSEDLYCAGWLIDLEYFLWHMLGGDSREFGLGVVPFDTVEELRELSIDCGGWIVWGPDDTRKKWVSMEEWQRMVDKTHRIEEQL